MGHHGRQSFPFSLELKGKIKNNKTEDKFCQKVYIGWVSRPFLSCPFLLFTSEEDVKWGNRKGQKRTKIRNQIL